MDRLPDDLLLAIWCLGWTHHAATQMLRKRFPQMLQLRWVPYWNLLRCNAITLALWGDHHHSGGWPAVACYTQPPPLWLHRPLPFPQLPAPPLFTRVVNGDVLACMVRDRLWLGVVRRILQNTTRHLGRYRRLRCAAFTLVQIDDDVFLQQHSSSHRVQAWAVIF